MSDFQGKTYLITGAASGIGKACTLAFHRLGANVVLLDRDTPELNAFATSLGANALACGLDIANSEACKQAVLKAVERFGTIDGVVAVQKALASAPPPFNFILAGIVGAAAAVNVAKIAGFERGGYTGDGGTKEVAGVVHGKEFVVNARSTAANRPLLEQMNRGRNVGDFLQKAKLNQGGGSPGLGATEMSTILKKVEQGLDNGTPRDGADGAPGGTSQSIRNVLVFSDEEIAGAMAGPAGERVFINHMRRNAPLVKQFASS